MSTEQEFSSQPVSQVDLLDGVEDPTILQPISEVSRKERRSLLATSLIAFALSQGGLIPNEISAFGISVSETERFSLLILMAMVVLYFEFAYLVYSAADIKARELAEFRDDRKTGPLIQNKLHQLSEALKDAKGEAIEDLEEQLVELARRVSEQSQLAGSVHKIGRVRVFFDVHLAVIIGFVAFAFVLTEIRDFSGPVWASWVVGIVATGVLLFYLYQYPVRREISRWLTRRRRNRHRKRYENLLGELKTGDLDQSGREQLKERIVKHMAESLR